MYTIRFADGSSLNGLTLNGNNFFSADPLDAEYFTPEKLKTVTFQMDGGGSAEYEDMEVVRCIPLDGGTEFILAQVTQEEKDKRLLRTSASDITDIQSALAELYEMMLGGV